MSQTTAINQELLRQINDSVGYKIKTKVDTLISQNGNDSSNISSIKLTQLSDSANISLITVRTANLVTDSANISYIANLSHVADVKLDDIRTTQLSDSSNISTITAQTANLLDDSANISFITAQTTHLLTDSANLSYMRSFFPLIASDANVAANGLQSIPGVVSNVKYLTEVTAINDLSLASTESKSLEFHKFLTTEHIPSSNIFAQLANLEKTNDTYATGLGAIGVRKNGVNVFEEYYNGNYPGSMFGTFSCGKELMGLMFGRMMQKRFALHNEGTSYTSNVLSLDTTVEQIIYGTDIKKYGNTGITLPRGLEKARMRDLLSMRAGFHEYDGLLWFMYWGDIFSGGGYANWATHPDEAGLNSFYRYWAGNLVPVPYRVTIDTFADIQNKGNDVVNLRNFGEYIKQDVLTTGATYTYTKPLYDFLTYSFYINFTSPNVVGDLFVGNGTSNTSVRYQRSAYTELYGTNKFEHYNNECFTFATEMMQIALAKEAKNGNGLVLPYPTYSNVAITDIGINTFGSSLDPAYVASVRDNFRTFFKREVLVPSGVPSANTKLTELQSDNQGTIMCDYTRVAFPHFMGINDTFANDLFVVRDNQNAVTNVYSNLFLSNITLYDFTANSSNIIPRLNALESDPFDVTTFPGEYLNAQHYLSMTNGIWTRTNILPNNRQETSNVYFMQGAQGQKCYMGRSNGSRYTVGMLSDDLVNNPLLCQGSEFLQSNKNTLTTVQAAASDYGKTDGTSTAVGYWFPDNFSVPIFAYGTSAIFGLRTRQEADKVVAYIQDIKISSNNWGYDSVGGPTLRLNAARAYYSALTVDSNIIQTADITTGAPLGYSNCIADAHYAQYDVFDRARSTF
jgi:hypothetical protein